MKLEGKLLDKFKRAVRDWAATCPNEPSIGVVGENLLTPLEFADHIERETDIGKEWIRIVELGATSAGMTPEQVFERIRRSMPKTDRNPEP